MEGEFSIGFQPLTILLNYYLLSPPEKML